MRSAPRELRYASGVRRSGCVMPRPRTCANRSRRTSLFTLLCSIISFQIHPLSVMNQSSIVMPCFALHDRVSITCPFPRSSPLSSLSTIESFGSRTTNLTQYYYAPCSPGNCSTGGTPSSSVMWCLWQRNQKAIVCLRYQKIAAFRLANSGHLYKPLTTDGYDQRNGVVFQLHQFLGAWKSGLSDRDEPWHSQQHLEHFQQRSLWLLAS